MTSKTASRRMKSRTVAPMRRQKPTRGKVAGSALGDAVAVSIGRRAAGILGTGTGSLRLFSRVNFANVAAKAAPTASTLAKPQTTKPRSGIM